MIIKTENFEIFSKEDSYIVRHKSTNKYIRLGSREVSYLLFLLGESDADIVKTENNEPLSEEQKAMLKERFSALGFFDKEVKKEKKELSDYEICSLQNTEGMKKILKVLSHFISPFGLILMCLLVVSSVWLIHASADKYVIGLTGLLNHMNLLWFVMMYAIFFICGIVHELAHSAACFRYSGDSGRIGIKLYYGVPAFFSDLSSMYTVEGRRESVIVSLAGVMSNIVMAAIAVSVYAFVPDNSCLGMGLLSAFILNAVEVVFNLIPFAKFDGYWVIRNLTAINNLYDKSISIAFLMVWKFKDYKIMDISTRKKATMTVYGVLCYLFTYYLWYIFLRTLNGLLVMIAVNRAVYLGIMFMAIIILITNIVMTKRKYQRTYLSFCQNIE